MRPGFFWIVLAPSSVSVLNKMNVATLASHWDHPGSRGHCHQADSSLANDPQDDLGRAGDNPLFSRRPARLRDAALLLRTIALVQPTDALELALVPFVGAWRCAEPRVQDLLRHRFRRGPQTEAEDVGVVPGARTASRLCIVIERCPSTRDLVGRKGCARAGPAHDDGLVYLTVDDELSRGSAHFRPIAL